MGLRYFDSETGRERFKRRYVWAFWGYFGGIATGMILLALLR